MTDTRAFYVPDDATSQLLTTHAVYTVMLSSGYGPAQRIRNLPKMMQLLSG